MSKPLRVLHVVTSLEPGGMENGVCNIAQQLAPRGIETSVACLERSGPFASRLPDPKRVEVLGKQSGFSPGAVFRLWRVIRRLCPDVVHSHNLGPLIYASLATIWGKSTPLLHGEHSQLAPWEKQPRRLRQRRRLYRACREIHTVSHPQREELLQLGFPAGRITAIPNGVDTERFVPRSPQDARRALGLPENGMFAGVVSRFGPYKGHAATLDAFTTVAPGQPDARLVFIGSGGSEEQSIREAIANHPFHDRIHVLGFRPDVETCYPALDLLLIPSINEGMSNAALEAMSCGVPVLANKGAGNEAIVTDSVDGWVDDLADAESYSARLRNILAAGDALRQAGLKARAKIETDFGLARMMQTYEELYRRLAE